ncbi:MAG TPA: YdeI/OmpD-associated family protein [Pirellulales bacterium]|nr:YdeI/OmpD-associated family protein [Pirellulales bacterium]
MPGKTSEKSANVAKKAAARRAAVMTMRRSPSQQSPRPRRRQPVPHKSSSRTPKSASRVSAQRLRELGDSKTAAKICFSATLFRPMATAKAVSWTFLTLPEEASAKLPSRGMTSVEGTLNGFHFRATLEPDGQGGHWLKVDRRMREAAGAEAGEVVKLEIAPVAKEPEPRVPADLRKALAAAPKSRELWSDITPTARRDWIQWIVSAKQAETRARRIKNACSMLASGKRRPCCFDRSGMYSKSLSSPVADDVK